MKVISSQWAWCNATLRGTTGSGGPPEHGMWLGPLLTVATVGITAWNRGNSEPFVATSVMFMDATLSTVTCGPYKPQDQGPSHSQAPWKCHSFQLVQGPLWTGLHHQPMEALCALCDVIAPSSWTCCETWPGAWMKLLSPNTLVSQGQAPPLTSPAGDELCSWGCSSTPPMVLSALASHCESRHRESTRPLRGGSNPFCKNLIQYDLWMFTPPDSHPVSIRSG